MSATRKESLDAIFATDGPLARALPGFEARAGQVQMSRLIERGFLESAHTLVEAGTGVGKSLAYLVPALRSGKKVVVSTATIALQEQLVRKDIPLVLGALGIQARVELLKGRNQYLCRSKLDRLRADRLIALSATMEAMWEWSGRTETGDRAELPFAPPHSEWELLDADADDCVGELCDRFRDCYFFARRDAAKYADIVVVNHALFFLDLALGGSLLPPYDYAILDEAHQCEQWASAALTATISPGTVGRMMRRLHRHYQVPATYDVEVDEGMRRLVQALASVSGDRYPLAANGAAEEALDGLRKTFYRLENWLYAHWQAALKRPTDNVAESERRRDNALRGIVAHSNTIERTHLPPDEAITWVERFEGEGRYDVNSAPFDVAEYLRTALFRRAQSVVLTSATLATHENFDFVKRALGVDKSTSRRRRSIIAAKRACTSRRRTAIRRVRASHAPSHRSSKSVSNSRAGARSCSSPHTSGCGKCTRSCARSCRSPQRCRVNCRARISWSGSARRATPCSLPPARSGKASTSSAISSRA
jgi:ATP-dependent DNA helicase DinG